MDELTLKKLQDTEYGILCVVDDFCKKHGIAYSLYAGTALGGVRHGGFIPWDDDIDIAMTRSEFDRFCKAWEAEPVKGYYLESILTDDRCGACHAKVRKDGTLFLSEGQRENRGHHGIWVDIFPMDKIATDRKIHAKKYRVGRKIVLLTRANADIRENDSLAKKAVRIVFRMIPRTVRNKMIRNSHRWLLEHMEDGVNGGYEWKSMSTLDSIREVFFLPNLVSGYTTIAFEGRKFPIFENYEDMLRCTYGDYMQLPPESERVCKHNPVKIKF